MYVFKLNRLWKKDVILNKLFIFILYCLSYLGGGGGGSLDRRGSSLGLLGVLADCPAPLRSVNLARGSKICDNRRDLSSDIITTNNITSHHYTALQTRVI
jgi:hypothetical protein